MSSFDRETVVVATAEQVSCDLAGEAVILSLTDDTYYGLNDVGALVWSLLQEPRAVCELCEAVLTDFEVEPDVCERDVLVLLDEMAVRGLVHAVAPAGPR